MNFADHFFNKLAESSDEKKPMSREQYLAERGARGNRFGHGGGLFFGTTGAASGALTNVQMQRDQAQAQGRHRKADGASRRIARTAGHAAKGALLGGTTGYVSGQALGRLAHLATRRSEREHRNLQ